MGELKSGWGLLLYGAEIMRFIKVIGIFFLLLNAAHAQIPDLTQYGRETKSSMESACNVDRVLNGPAAYASCLNKQIAQYRSGFPDLRPTIQQAAVPSTQTNNAERDRLNAEVEAERKKRQELEQQLASSRDREKITAELDLERKKRQELEAQLAASVKPTPPQTSAPRRIAHALVIGNGAYPGSGRLDNPVNDANAISQKLRSMGFTVTTVTDANRQRLVQSMTQFRRTAASADISLLYYAGHGVQIFGTNYILPTDVDQTDPA